MPFSGAIARGFINVRNLIVTHGYGFPGTASSTPNITPTEPDVEPIEACALFPTSSDTQQDDPIEVKSIFVVPKGSDEPAACPKFVVPRTPKRDSK